MPKRSRTLYQSARCCTVRLGTFGSGVGSGSKLGVYLSLRSVTSQPGLSFCIRATAAATSCGSFSVAQYVHIFLGIASRSRVEGSVVVSTDNLLHVMPSPQSGSNAWSRMQTQYKLCTPQTRPSCQIKMMAQAIKDRASTSNL